MALKKGGEFLCALGALWEDSCTIIEYQEYTKKNKSTGQREAAVLENQPCRLSFKSLRAAEQSRTAARLTQVAKLFLNPDVIIKPGSIIIVTQKGGRVFKFKQSGEAGVFTNHQEIMLAPFEDYA